MSIEAADIHQHPRISNFHREPYVYRYIHRYNALWRDECTSTYIYITQVFTWKCVGAAAYIKEIRESGGGDELGKGWKGTMGVGSKTEGENVPREIIDCIRWVSIPGADCAAQLLPRKPLGLASSHACKYGWPAATVHVVQLDHAANGKCLLEITNLATSPSPLRQLIGWIYNNNRGF